MTDEEEMKPCGRCRPLADALDEYAAAHAAACGGDGKQA